MRVDVLVKCYNRPQCTKSLLDALQQQRGHGLTIDQVIVFQDGAKGKKDHALVKESTAIAKASAIKADVRAASENLNANGNCKRFWDHMINSSADAFLTFEDDVLPGPDYFAAIEKLLRLSNADPSIGMVTAMGMLGHSAATQHSNLQQLMPMGYIWGVHRWGWAALKDRILQMAPYVMGYFDHCISIGYPGDSVNGAHYQALVKPWLEERGFYQDQTMFGYDVTYDMAAYKEGLINISTFASFGVSRGDTGTSFSRETFETYRYHQTELSDDLPEEFLPFSAAQTVQILRLINRFHTSWMLAANPVLPSPPTMTRPQLIKAYYTQILGRDMTEEDIVGHRVHLLVNAVDEISDYALAL